MWTRPDVTLFARGDCLSRVAVPWELLTSPASASLAADEKPRLLVGEVCFTPEQEAEITALRERWKDLLEPADRR
jgi:hypothetical protein